MALCGFLLLLLGCSHESPLDDPATLCKVRLDVDWSAAKIELDGMTAIFYPIDGSQRSEFLSNQVTGKEIRLKEGVYNVVVFNQAAGDFSYFSIEGQDQYATLRVVMKERASEWYEPENGERVAHEPEPFAVSLVQGFEVTKAMIDASYLENKVFPFTCQPTTVTRATKLSVHIKGLYNIKEARGSIQNMADTYWITKKENGKGGITHTFTLADKKYDSGSTKDGILSGHLYSFGAPGATTKAETTNLLTLSILLVDNKTVIKRTYDVTKQINAPAPTPGEEQESEVVIGGGTPSDPDNPDAPDNQPIELPDVKPEGGGEGGGFDASVDDWGDETNIDIPV